MAGGRPDAVNDPARRRHELDLFFEVAGGRLPIADDGEREGPGRKGQEIDEPLGSLALGRSLADVEHVGEDQLSRWHPPGG